VRCGSSRIGDRATALGKQDDGTNQGTDRDNSDNGIVTFGGVGKFHESNTTPRGRWGQVEYADCGDAGKCVVFIMKSHRPSRLDLGAALLVLCAAAPAFARGRGRLPGPPPPTQQRAQQRAQQRSAQGQPHLKKWLEDHKNLTPAEQEREMQNEPGFRELTPQMQQQELQLLRKLNGMPAQQRDRMLDRNEMVERMTSQQRQLYRSAVQQLTAAPPPRQRFMLKAIFDLRMMPLGQREQVIESPAYAAQFSQSERSTIRTVLMGEPYNPTP
jgi:hypothetical protein